MECCNKIIFFWYDVIKQFILHDSYNLKYWTLFLGLVRLSSPGD